MKLIDNNLENWIRGSPEWMSRKKTKASQLDEYNWSLKYHTSTCKSQWSSLFGELLVCHLLTKRGHVVRRPLKKEGLLPDWETEEGIYEVKTRNYSTSGTAGEKIWGVGVKYEKVPELYGKPLYIVCVGFQEIEAFKTIDDDTCPIAQNLLNMYKEHNIHYVRCSSLL